MDILRYEIGSLRTGHVCILLDNLGDCSAAEFLMPIVVEQRFMFCARNMKILDFNVFLQEIGQTLTDIHTSLLVAFTGDCYRAWVIVVDN